MAQETAVTELDVSAIDGEPFPEIVSALETLGPGDTLRLVSAFEPVPLYDVLDARGFAHETERVDSDMWRVTIRHE
jgi:uncharacterized protein (DUF2249 family)